MSAGATMIHASRVCLRCSRVERRRLGRRAGPVVVGWVALIVSSSGESEDGGAWPPSSPIVLSPAGSFDNSCYGRARSSR